MRGVTLSLGFSFHAYEFQPTRPVRGVTNYPLGRCDKLISVSTHTPRAGRDRWIIVFLTLSLVSTHTPRAGRDKMLARPFIVRVFQPTRPVRGVTALRSCLCLLIVFQPTRPVRGVTGRPRKTLPR